MKDLFATLKRLFEPRPPPADTIVEPTADRPPPPPAEPPPIESARPPEPAAVDPDELAEIRAALEAVAEGPVASAEPEPEAELFPAPEAEVEPPVSDAAAAHAPAPAEVSVPADAPASAEVSAPADVPAPVPPRPDVPAPAPVPAHQSTPSLATSAVDETAEAPAPAAEHVAGALVLSLGTPAVTFTVAKTSATLGRGPENTIRLDDLSVSRRHARIAYRQGGYWLSDLGSMGGTWVNGTRLSAPRRLALDEVIDIGLLRLTVAFAGGDVKAEPRKSAKPRSEIAGQVKRRR